MNKQTANSLFMFSPLEARYAELYQGLLRDIGSYQQLGNRLIQLAEQAHAFRQFDKVRELGQVLSNIPIKHYQAIGYYFLAVGLNSNGHGDPDKAGRLLELAVDTAPDAYRSKAILSLAAVSFNKRDFGSTLYFCREAAKTGFNISSIQAIKGISLLKAMEGNHNSTLKDLERLYPLFRYAPPRIHSNYLNSLAVESRIERKNHGRGNRQDLQRLL
jgi:hypothetical protein